MKWQQKIAVYFLAMLILYIGIGYPTISAYEVAPESREDTTLSYIEPAPVCTVILVQEKPATLPSGGWKTSVRIPGFAYYDENIHAQYPELTVIGKILVVDAESFYPCKSLLLFPFHDFI
jgi:hypothetical protein